MKENLKVAGASLLGIGATLPPWVSDLEPVLRVLVACGQIGVAIVTIIYILAKIRKMHRK